MISLCVAHGKALFVCELRPLEIYPNIDRKMRYAPSKLRKSSEWNIHASNGGKPEG
jgi:hypothetical protein